MPVGRVEYMHLSPMTFFEFLYATGEEILARKLEKSNFKDWQTFHEKLLKLLRTYYFVGGMPEAVKVYSTTRSALKASNVHRSILQTYKDDFSKYKTRIGIEKISSFFEKIPNGLGKKVKFSNIFPEEKSATVAKLVDLFIKAKIVLPCYHSNGAIIPLFSQKDDSVFKLYFLDIGLLHHLHGLEAEDIIKKEGTFLTDGLSAEQFAAQHLAYASTPAEEPRLFYWLRDKKKENAELDFLISKKSSVIPVEVKAGKSGTLKSLFWFMGTYKHKTAIRMDMKERTTADVTEKVSSSIVNQESKVQCRFDLLNIPLYMAEQVYALLDTIREK
jgi:predicted AAA+ superfamily ATPase